MKKFLIAAVAALGIYLLTTPAASRDMGEYFLAEKSTQVIRLTPPSSESRGGTGFALRTPNGNVVTVTNAHICEVAEGGMLMAEPEGYGRRVPIQVKEVDEEHDLCILEGVKFMTGLTLAERGLRMKSSAHILGHPLLKDVSYSRGYTIQRRDIDIAVGGPDVPCTGKNRSIKEIPFGPFLIAVCVASVDAIEIDAPIFPGNSGSPVMNSEGDVVGVVFAADGRTNHGFYIPFERLVEVVATY